MATLPSKNALNDLTGGYYSYWTDGTTEGRATVAVLLGSTDAQAAAASFSSLALGTPLSAANGGTGLTSISTLLNSNVTPASLGLVIGTNVQAYSATLDALIASPLTASTAASTYLTQASAASTYLTQANAASTYLTIATAASTYQPLDPDLTAIAALSSADGNFIVGSATGWVAESGATARTSLGLGNVENTALSTWAGSTSISTLGTIATGVWNGTAIDSAYIDQSLSVAMLTASTSVTVASDLTLASGSITSASGAISFSDENLSTTGTFASGNTTVTGTLGVTGNLTVDTNTLYVDAAANAVRIGTTIATSHAEEALRVSGTFAGSGGLIRANFHSADGGGSAIQFTNSTTGITNTQGVIVGLVNGSEQAGIWHYGAYAQVFGTNNTERFRVAATAANILVKGITSPAGMDGGVVLFNGTAPSAGATDAVALYSKDLSAGNTMLGIYTEGTPVGSGTPTQDRTIAVEVNGTTLYILASTTAS